MGRGEVCTPQAAVIVGVFLASACEPATHEPPPVLVTDSAGVTVIESTMPRWTAEERWWVDSVPEVLIGGLDPGEKYAFGDVDGVTRFPDGRIVVLDGAASVVRVYDPAGEHLFDVGGPGDGPAEFRRPQFVGLLQDTIVVYDQLPPTLSWFDDTGAFLRTVLLAQTSGRRQLYGPAHGLLGRDGIVLVAGPPTRPRLEPGVTSRPRGLWRLELDGSSADSLSALRGEEISVQTTGRFNRLTFGSTTHVTTTDAWIYVADSRSYSVQMRDIHGTVKRVIRRAVRARRVVDDDLDRYAHQLLMLEGMPEELGAALRRRLDDIGAASEMPVLRTITADREGYLWVEEWRDVGLSQGPFSIFDPAGVWLGTVELPAGLPVLRGTNRELEFGSDYVLGVWTDALDVQQVRLYRLHKPKAP